MTSTALTGPCNSSCRQPQVVRSVAVDVWPLRSPTLQNHVKPGASDRPRRTELQCALENRLHGYIVVNQQLSWLQVGYNR
jgi:hypothetical protein